MEVFRQELNAFPLRAMLDQAAEDLGESGLEEVLRQYSVARKDISSSDVWVSVEFVDVVLRDIMTRLNDPAFLERAARRGLSRRYMGPLYPLLVGFGTPLFTYRQTPRGGDRMDKQGGWSLGDSRPGFIRMIWTANPGANVARFLCTFKRYQLGYLPVLFSRTPARVDHPECIFEGGSRCVYDIAWQEMPARREPRNGMLAGLVVGAGGALALGAQAPVLVPLALVGGVAGWALGKVWVMRSELQVRLKDIDEHNHALDRVTQRNEQRYAELLEAKADVEKKVEERTAELSLATAQLSRTLTQVQELDRAKTNFFSNVSHDLRTPLTLILGPLSEMAAGREPPGGRAHAVDVMQRNGTRLLNLINQLLDLAKIDDGKMQIARNPTDVLDLARNVETRFSAAAEQRGLTLATVGAQLAPISLDSTWIETALTNLVANAMRFAKSKVSLRVSEEDGAVRLEVEDDGVGIAAADIDKVFDRFAQGSDSQARKGGTGLGLAIVREAARLHGGDASVRSEPGVATVFTMVLPRAMRANEAGHSVRPDSGPVDVPTPQVGRLSAQDAAVAADVANASLRPPTPVALQLEWPGPDPSAPLVVVVEDDDDLRGFTSQVLAAQYRVKAARNGQEGLALIAELHPDAVVSDVVMPVMDGYELARQLRRRDDTRTLPVILLTARRDVGRVLEGFEAGADDYVTKPFQARELLARVGVHVRLRQVVSEMAHRERLASLGVLAASLAHQVRNPLNAILAGLPAVRRKLAAALKANDDEIFGAMIDSAERINTLIGDLMDLSRVDSDAIATFNPAIGVQASIRLIDARAPGSVHVSTEIDDSIELEGKPGDMNHVFLNILDNAFRAAGDGGQVQVHVQRRNNMFVFEVGDSGPGIPADKTEAVFAPFFTTRQAGEGTGLGLAIARQVVLQHGGRISVGTSPLGGALFTVELPATPKPAPAALSASA